MDKSCEPSSADSTTTSTDTNNNNRDNYLRHLNKLSHKISKPPILNNINKTSFDPPSIPPLLQQQQQQLQNFNNNNNNNPLQQQQPPTQNPQHQPPVYNINKNDFRDVVQKLTGAPANDRISTPQPIQQQPKQQSSRLQRIRPPPLPNINNRPPPLLNAPPQPQHNNFNFNFNAVNFNQNFPGFGNRAPAPLSPLPPFPTVHAAAESPISAYMRDLQSFKGFSGFSPLPLPPVPSLSQPQNQQQQQEQENQPPPQQQEVVQPPPVSQSQSPFQMPSSPGPFGCLNSQLASYPLLSPGLLFSPNSGNLGFPQLPLSPTVPVPSPRWKGI
ncbi:VQ motif-containing protein [Trifolium repens]|nr:VQ motif-containing protein [Trifolium repens]